MQRRDEQRNQVVKLANPAGAYFFILNHIVPATEMRPLLSHNTRSAFLKLQNLQISSNFQGIRTTPEKRGDVVFVFQIYWKCN